MNYSKIKSLSITDYKSISDLEVEFDDSNIIALRGSGEAGKSSVIGALATVCVNKNSRSQKNHIKNGTEGFVIKLTLEDGTEITRSKSLTDNLANIVYPNGEKWSTSKFDGGGNPAEIEKIIGMKCEPETKEHLGIRSYLTPLLFVDTKESTNYKVIRTALDLYELTKAIHTGNAESNTLKSKINHNSNLLVQYKDELKEIEVINLESLDKLYTRLKETQEKYNLLSTLRSEVEQIGKLEKQLEQLAPIDSLEVIDLSTHSKVRDILNSLIDYKKLSEEYTVYKELEESIIDLAPYKSVLDVKNKLQEYMKINQEFNNVSAELEDMLQKIKESGYIFCKQCGYINEGSDCHQ